MIRPPPSSPLFPTPPLFRSPGRTPREDRVRPPPAGTVEHVTCLGCGCACDDITVVVQRGRVAEAQRPRCTTTDRKSTRLNSSHLVISYAVFCLKKKKNMNLMRIETVGNADTDELLSSTLLQSRILCMLLATF